MRGGQVAPPPPPAFAFALSERPLRRLQGEEQLLGEPIGWKEDRKLVGQWV
jgi:hypothetical protein